MKRKTQRVSTAVFSQPARELARDLLGTRLFSRVDGELVGGMIVEVEAYLPHADPACHAARGQTRSNKSMFSPGGISYVYPIHAKYCFNVVAEPEGEGTAVLVRAIEPLHGVDRMQERRGTSKERDLARGPARLCQALGLDRSHDGLDLKRSEVLWIEPAEEKVKVGCTTRIGVTSGEELMLRWIIPESRFVSGTRKLNASAVPE